MYTLDVASSCGDSLSTTRGVRLEIEAQIIEVRGFRCLENPWRTVYSGGPSLIERREMEHRWSTGAEQS